jgi:hypothetical protein
MRLLIRSIKEWSNMLISRRSRNKSNKNFIIREQHLGIIVHWHINKEDLKLHKRQTILGNQHQTCSPATIKSDKVLQIMRRWWAYN